MHKLPSNPDEQHYFGGNDEHFPIFAECSDLKSIKKKNQEIQLRNNCLSKGRGQT